jgi:hypothetical protein
MNRLVDDLPTIDEKACNYAVLEYEINQILKEFDCQTSVNDSDEKTTDYIFKKLNVIHNQIKILKSKHKISETELKDAERQIAVYKEEIDILTEHLEKKMDTSSSLDSEWNESIDEREFNAHNHHNLDFSKVLFTRPNFSPEPEIERKSQIFKQIDDESEEGAPKSNDNDIADMLNLKPISVPKPSNLNKFSFYPIPFFHSTILVQKYLKGITKEEI